MLCFFRIDAEDGIKGLLDEDNAALLLQSHGINITSDKLRTMIPAEAQLLVKKVVKPNPLLSSHKTHTVQLPSLNMDKFGDAVIVIKDELEFVKRIKAAVEKRGESCIMGDVQYHELEDQVDPSTLRRNSLTVISSQTKSHHPDDTSFATDGVFNLSVLEGKKNIYWRGCLDKL